MDSPNIYLSPEEREKLENARVGIAGAGGLGSNCAMHLVRAGVKKLVIADFDTVVPSNLNRQFFFARQIGMKKTEALSENLRAISSGVELELRDTRIDGRNAVEIFGDCDVTAEAFDGAEAKATLIGALASRGRTVVAASGIAGWGRSNEIRLRKAADNLYIAGDMSSGIGEGMHPASPRVGIAAAMQANTIIAILLGKMV